MVILASGVTAMSTMYWDKNKLTRISYNDEKNGNEKIASKDFQNNTQNNSNIGTNFNKLDMKECVELACASKLEMFQKALKARGSNLSSNQTQIVELIDSNAANSNSGHDIVNDYNMNNDCPLDKEDIGRMTWSLLHTIAASLPDTDTKELSEDYKLELSNFMKSFAFLYPCHICAPDFQQYIEEFPPRCVLFLPWQLVTTFVV